MDEFCSRIQANRQLPITYKAFEIWYTATFCQLDVLEDISLSNESKKIWIYDVIITHQFWNIILKIYSMMSCITVMCVLRIYSSLYLWQHNLFTTYTHLCNYWYIRNLLQIKIVVSTVLFSSSISYYKILYSKYF